jgi:hypothetical protein
MAAKRRHLTQVALQRALDTLSLNALRLHWSLIIWAEERGRESACIGGRFDARRERAFRPRAVSVP